MASLFNSLWTGQFYEATKVKVPQGHKSKTDPNSPVAA